MERVAQAEFLARRLSVLQHWPMSPLSPVSSLEPAFGRQELSQASEQSSKS